MLITKLHQKKFHLWEKMVSKNKSFFPFSQRKSVCSQIHIYLENLQTMILKFLFSGYTPTPLGSKNLEQCHLACEKWKKIWTHRYLFYSARYLNYYNSFNRAFILCVPAVMTRFLLFSFPQAKMIVFFLAHLAWENDFRNREIDFLKLNMILKNHQFSSRKWNAWNCCHNFWYTKDERAFERVIII